MTHVIAIDIQTPNLFENQQVSRPLPFNAFIREIYISTTLTTPPPTLLIGITNATEYPNAPPPTEWRNILSYLSNIDEPADRRLNLLANPIRLTNLHIPIARGEVLAFLHYNPHNTDVHTTNIIITLQEEQ